MFGFGTLLSTPSCTATFICPEKGGLYPDVNLDVIFHKRIGFNFETAWRATQGSYNGEPYRPIILDFNAIYQPRVGKKLGLDLMGGVGLQSTRFYLPYCTSEITCNNFETSHHFLIDLGAGLRYYVRGHIFIRPEARYYYVINNDNLNSTLPPFTSNSIIRVGASIGYTIGPD